MRSKRQRHRTQERGRDREYNVTCATHISTSGTGLPYTFHNPSGFNIITSVYLSENHFSGRRQLQGKGACGVSPVTELQKPHHSIAFLSISKALAHDSAATHLKMFHWIDTECRKPQMGEQCQQTNNV